MSHERPNWSKLPNGAYLVRTKAGFRHVLRDALDPHQSAPGPTPHAYPVVVCFTDHGRSMTCQHVSRYYCELRRLLTCLEALDPMLLDLPDSPAGAPGIVPSSPTGLTTWEGIKLKLKGIVPDRYYPRRRT
jgi:hypothetical protein